MPMFVNSVPVSWFSPAMLRIHALEALTRPQESVAVHRRSMRNTPPHVGQSPFLNIRCTMQRPHAAHLHVDAIAGSRFTLPTASGSCWINVVKYVQRVCIGWRERSGVKRQQWSTVAGPRSGECWTQSTLYAYEQRSGKMYCNCR